MKITILLASSSLAFAAQVAFSPCPLIRSYSIPPSIASIKNAQLPAKFQEDFAQLVQQSGHPIYGNITSNTTSFSVVFFSGSLSMGAQDSPVFMEYHYTSPYDVARNFTAVTGDSKFPLAHVTTVFTVYAWLVQMGDEWDTSITRFLPELKGHRGVFDIAWDDITVGALAGHTSGLPYSSILKDISSQGPLFLPETTPAISLVAFQILAAAMERAQNGSHSGNFSTILQSTIFKPLNMRNTLLLSRENRALRQLNKSIQGEPAALALMSTTNDLAQAGQGILSSRLISPVSTRKWLTRSVDTSNLRNGVGYPWEIYRAGSKPISPIFAALTKSGAVGPFASYFGISPDFNVGFALLARDYTAKPGQLDLNAYVDVISESIGPLARVAAMEMGQRYSGTFRSESGSQLDIIGSSLGIEITSMTENGDDVKKRVADSLGFDVKNLDFRLYPTPVQNVTRHQFVSIFQDKNAPIDAGTPTCVTWQTAGSIAPAKFVFELNSDGVAMAVSVSDGERYQRRQ